MHNTWIELDPRILRENLRGMRKALSRRSQIIFVVKANAYGHGMIPVAKCAAGVGVKWFGVVHTDEAALLRAALPACGIILLGVILPDEVPEAIDGKFVPVVVGEEHARALAKAAAARRKELRCHVKIDTGMGRLGIIWEKAPEEIARISRLAGLKIDGICSHLASSDARDLHSSRPPRPSSGIPGESGLRRAMPNGNWSFAQVQADRFEKVVAACRRKGITFKFRHISNSGGFQYMPQCDYEGVRCGIMVYGYGPRRPGFRVATRPFLQWKTRILQVRRVPAGFTVGYGSTHKTRSETHIASLDAGYSDGYFRALGNKGKVVIGGRRVPVVGRVSMNLITVDLGPVTDVKAGDEAVLLGEQGGASVWADEIAEWCGTISYEVLTGIRAAPST